MISTISTQRIRDRARTLAQDAVVDSRFVARLKRHGHPIAMLQAWRRDMRGMVDALMQHKLILLLLCLFVVSGLVVEAAGLSGASKALATVSAMASASVLAVLLAVVTLGAGGLLMAAEECGARKQRVSEGTMNSLVKQLVTRPGAAPVVTELMLSVFHEQGYLTQSQARMLVEADDGIRVLAENKQGESWTEMARYA